MRMSWTSRDCWNVGCKYQIRTTRTGRRRLVTIQAWAKNGVVPEGEKAAVAALKMVNNVFNFFLSCLIVKPRGKSFSMSFSFAYCYF